MAGQVYFGNDKFQTWIPAPSTGMNASSSGYSAVTELLNGRSFVKRSFGASRKFGASWTGSMNNSNLSQSLQAIKDFSDGLYGDGKCFWIDPYAANQNVMPPHWAAPMLAESDWPALVGNATPTITPNYRSNIISNPSFETNLNDWVSPFGLTFTRITGTSFDGSYSMQLTNATGAQYATATNRAGGARLAVTPGQTYTFSYYIKNVTSTSAWFATLKGFSGAVGGVDIFIADGAGAIPVTSSWSRLSVTGVVPAGVNYLEGWAVNGSPDVVNARVYIDAVLLERSPNLNAYYGGTITAGPGNNYPIKYASYNITGPYVSDRKLNIIIPPTHTLHFGWHAFVAGISGSSTTGIRITPYNLLGVAQTAVNPVSLLAGGTTKTNQTFSGSSVSRVEIYLVNPSSSTDLTSINAMIAQVLPTGATVSAGGFIPGKGTTALKFSGPTDIEYYSSNINEGQIGLSASFVEVD